MDQKQIERIEAIEVLGEPLIEEMNYILYSSGKFYDLGSAKERWVEISGEKLTREQRIERWNELVQRLPEKIVFDLNVPHFYIDPRKGLPKHQCVIMHYNLERQGYKAEDLSGFNFKGFRTIGQTRLDNAQLRGTDLSFSRVDSLYIRNSDLTNASLEGLSIDGATLWGNKFYNTNMRKMKVEHGYFLDSKFKNADLSDSEIEGMLVGTTWEGDYRGVDFRNCRVNNADFSKAILRPEQISRFWLRAGEGDVKLPAEMEKYKNNIEVYGDTQ